MSNGNELAKASNAAMMERVLIKGDLKDMKPADKLGYLNAVCEAVGVDPLTKPFEFITLNGKEQLYALKSCTEQLRNNRNINLVIVSRQRVEDCWVVTARAELPNGRTDESIGAVNILNAKGESLANALMKAETKAKRRVTLSICGLGMLDETELEAIPQYAKAAKGQSAPSTPKDALKFLEEREKTLHNPAIPSQASRDKAFETELRQSLQNLEKTLHQSADSSEINKSDPVEAEIVPTADELTERFYRTCEDRGFDRLAARSVMEDIERQPAFMENWGKNPVDAMSRVCGLAGEGRYDKSLAKARDALSANKAA